MNNLKLRYIISFLLLFLFACEKTNTYLDEEERTPYVASQNENDIVSVESLEVYPQNLSFVVGESAQLSVIANYSNQTRKDASSEVKITIDNNEIMSLVNNQTKFQAEKEGQATVTIELEGIKILKKIEVKSGIFKSIQIENIGKIYYVGQEKCFSVNAILSDYSIVNMTKSVIWSSSDSDSLILDQSQEKNGCFTFQKVGVFKVFAEYQSFKIEHEIQIQKATLEDIITEQNILTVPLGMTVTTKATGLYSDGTSLDISLNCDWKSNDSKIASIEKFSNEIKISGEKEGLTTIEAVIDEQKTVQTILVINAVLEKIEVTSTDITLPKGKRTQFIATGIFSDESTLDLTSQVTWSSALPSILSISNAEVNRGEALGLLSGETNITATFNEIVGEKTYQVIDAELTYIEVNGDSDSLPEGLTRQYQAMGYYSDGSNLDLTSEVVWSTTNPSGATVSNATEAKGLLTAVKNGEYEVKATLGSFISKKVIAVSDAKLIAISFLNESPLTKHGLSINMSALGQYTDGVSRSITSSVFWSIDYSTTGHSKVAWISNSSNERGKIYTINQGVAIIKATLEGIEHSVEFNVTEKEIYSLSISPTNSTIDLGNPVTFNAIAVYTDGTTIDVTDTNNLENLNLVWNKGLGNPIDLNYNGTIGLMNPTAEAINTISATLTTNWGNFSKSTSLTIQTPCANGTRQGLYCWYYGAQGESCSNTCTDNGGYHEATAFYAGANGTSIQCRDILTVFGFNNTNLTNIDLTQADNLGIGCSALVDGPPTPIRMHYTSPATNEFDSHVSHRRVCACKN